MPHVFNEGDFIKHKYQVEKILYSDSGGVIYKCKYNKGYKAVKQLFSSEKGKKRKKGFSLFSERCEALKNLSHKNLAKVEDYFVEESGFYVVLEYIKGKTLEDIYQKEYKTILFPYDILMGHIIKICDVLAYMHSQCPPLLYGHLSPGSVMIGRAEKLKLINYGLSGIVRDGKNSGCECYRSPEQIRGKSENLKSDVYSIGSLMYYLLTGTTFDFKAKKAKPVRSFNRSVPPGLEKIILNCLDKNPSARPELKDLSRQLTKFYLAETMRKATCPGTPEGREETGGTEEDKLKKAVKEKKPLKIKKKRRPGILVKEEKNLLSPPKKSFGIDSTGQKKKEREALELKEETPAPPSELKKKNRELAVTTGKDTVVLEEIEAFKEEEEEKDLPSGREGRGVKKDGLQKSRKTRLISLMIRDAIKQKEEVLKEEEEKTSSEEEADQKKEPICSIAGQEEEVITEAKSFSPEKIDVIKDEKHIPEDGLSRRSASIASFLKMKSGLADDSYEINRDILLKKSQRETGLSEDFLTSLKVTSPSSTVTSVREEKITWPAFSPYTKTQTDPPLPLFEEIDMLKNNRYEVVELFHKDCYGALYIVEDYDEEKEDKKEKILKEIQYKGKEPEKIAKLLERFQETCKELKKLEHPGLASVEDYFYELAEDKLSLRLFLIVEYVEGMTFEEIAETYYGEDEKSQMPATTVFGVITKVFSALDYLHSNGVVYGDLRASNLKLTPDGNVKFLNYGLCNIFQNTEDNAYPFKGTYGYVAPELVSLPDADFPSDIFSLGAVIYFMLTGKKPQDVKYNFISVRKFNPYLSPRVERFIQTILDFTPSHRPDVKQMNRVINNMDFFEVVKDKKEVNETPVPPSETSVNDVPPGKTVQGWKENIMWAINKYVPAKYLSAGIIALVIICIVLIYNFINLTSGTGGKIAYLLENDGKSVTFMSLASGRITDSVETGSTLGGICVVPDGRYLYVSRVGDKIAVIDISQKKEITDIIVKTNPVNLVLSYDGKAIFTVNRKADCVSVIEISSQMVQGHIEAGKEPVDAVATKDKLYIANYSSKDITVIDLKDNSKKIKDIPLEGKPVAMAFNPSVQKIYVANDGYEAVSVIDTGTDLLKTNINAPAFTRDIAVSPDGKFVYAAIAETRSLFIIDPVKDEKISEIVIDENIASIDISPDGKYLYICSPSSSENRPGKIIVYNRQSSVKEKVIETGKKQFVKMFLAPLTEK